MAGNQLPADGLSSNLSGMSKTQLYDIMSQLKTLIDQNPDQAKEILVQNPVLTRALFQAQIMLGMVQPPPAVPNIQPPAASSKHPQQSAQTTKPSNSPPAQIDSADQTSGSQPPTPLRKQPNPPLDSQSQTQSLPTNPLQPSQQSKGHSNAQSPVRSVSQPPLTTQPARSTASTQLQQPLPTSGGVTHMPSQPPLPTQPRPPSVPAYPHPQMGRNASFRHSTAPQLHHSQPMFQSGVKPPASMGSSFSQGQPPVASQAPPYQGGGGSHMGMEFGQVGSSSLQGERATVSSSSGGGGWIPETSSPSHFSGQASFSSSTYIPGLMGPGNVPTQPSSQQLTPDLEKALLQQVMSLGPDQVNLLPPDQRNQILQLQRILRHQQ